MKTFVAALAAVTLTIGIGSSLSAEAGGSFDKSACTFNGKRLYGKIEVVTALADVKVQVVPALADLRVQKVKAFPDACGKWEMVTALPDTTVEFVPALADVKVQFVNAFPGTN